MVEKQYPHNLEAY